MTACQCTRGGVCPRPVRYTEGCWDIIIPAILIIPSEVFISPIWVVCGGMLTVHKWLSAIPMCCCSCGGLFFTEAVVAVTQRERQESSWSWLRKHDHDACVTAVMHSQDNYCSWVKSTWMLIKGSWDAQSGKFLLEINKVINPSIYVFSLHRQLKLFVLHFQCKQQYNKSYWCIVIND